MVAPVIEQVPETPARRRRMVPRLPVSRWSNPLLLIAAALLVVGAVLGNWFALLLGWLIAYASRRLSDAETKAAVIGLRGGRRGRDRLAVGPQRRPLGHPHRPGPHERRDLRDLAVGGAGAAVASALFLVWRSQRRR